MRSSHSHKISDLALTKDALLEWSRSQGDFLWLDSNGHRDGYSNFEACLALGQEKAFGDLEELKGFVGQHKDWLFGHFSYGLKDVLEELGESQADALGFPTLHFFRPRKLIILQPDRLWMAYLPGCAREMEGDLADILAWVGTGGSGGGKSAVGPRPPIKMRIDKEEYLERAEHFLEHIRQGDIYEANFCQEFYAEGFQIDPWDTYARLNAISRSPFAALMKTGQRHLICSSPERYLRKQGQKLISQPIKGTAPRGGDQREDKRLREGLASDPKERAENVMIVDLVRNDLSKSALRGSVKVEELCGVHAFRQVNQMISTISARVAKDKNPVELIAETFPMGSMTGAPKISAMKIIERLEEGGRGLYSGSVGYFDPNGNFDFNVVIRSILYQAEEKYVSFWVGSAITAGSDPEREYQECLLKARAMRSVLEEGGT